MKKYLFIFFIACFVFIAVAGCTEGLNPDDAVDVDLTALNKTMMIAMIDNIYVNSDEYIGKTIKMGGQYFSDYIPPDQHYHYIIFFDESACCSYGFEFIVDGNHMHPDDFPEEETDIEVTGVLKSYEEYGQTWFFLETDEIVT